VAVRYLDEGEAMPQIEILPSDRVLIIGTSDSGKSWLTRRVLVPAFAVNPVVLDPKERWEAYNAEVVEQFTPGHPYQVVRLGDYDEAEGPALWDAVVQAAMRDRVPHTIIVDELTLVTKSQQLPRGLGRAVRTGRDTKRGAFGVWMLTQQPAFIPTVTYALSNHKFIFMCERAADIKRIGEETTEDIVPFIADLRQGDYVYYNKQRALIIPVERKREASS
jgi:hypothetical protein